MILLHCGFEESLGLIQIFKDINVALEAKHLSQRLVIVYMDRLDMLFEVLVVR